MKRYLAAMMCVAMLGANAAAQPSDEMKRPEWFLVKPADAWLKDPAQSRSIAASTLDNNAFAEPTLAGGAEVYVPSGGGVLLIVSWLTGEQAIKNGGVAVRRHLKQIKDTQQSASGGTLGWKTAITANVAQLTFEWSNATDQIAAFGRSLIWFNAEHKVRLVTAECRYRVSIAEALRKGCLDAIASLRLRGRTSERAPLELPPPTNERKGVKVTGGSDIPTAKIDVAGTGKPTVIHQESTKKKPSREHWLLIVGVIIVIIAFYLSTRSRRGDIPVTPEQIEIDPELVADTKAEDVAADGEGDGDGKKEKA